MQSKNIGDLGFWCQNCPKNWPLPTAIDDFEDLKDLEVEALTGQGASPYLFSLRKVDWLIKGTLTWAEESLRTHSTSAPFVRKKHFRVLLNEVRQELRLSHRNFACFCREETSPGGLAHYHFMLAKKGLERVPTAKLIHFLIKGWRYRGNCHVEEVKTASDGLDAVNYCAKKDEFRPWNVEPVDYVSKSLMKLMKSLPD